MVSRISRSLNVAVVAAIFVSLGIAQQPQQARAVVDRYCVACHNNQAKQGGLALDIISSTNVSENTEI